ncbi:RHS repeat-associated core domain-containing protein [Marinicauda algicola]|uniref:RHS repeat-associated core domain-containing protein n=1 Tax=Marinicauda algicola TaxID=2029849 RepID=UPI0024040698|nr:RHS repeat-associated core domain-containing protein [Marinicauda algicola]
MRLTHARRRTRPSPGEPLHRSLSPILRRIAHTDSAGNTGGINLYAYVGGDPVNFVDPWGLSEICAPSLWIHSGQPVRDENGNIIGREEGSQLLSTINTCYDFSARNRYDTISFFGGGGGGGGDGRGKEKDSARCRAAAITLRAAHGIRNSDLNHSPANVDSPGQLVGTISTFAGHLAAGGSFSSGAWFHRPSGSYGTFRSWEAGGGLSLGGSNSLFWLEQTTPGGFEGTGVSLAGALLFGGMSAIVARESGSVFDEGTLSFRGSSAGVAGLSGYLRAGGSFEITRTTVSSCK